jgi:ubiquinol-cytochrome c reductase cytochrome b subunit
MSTPAHIVPEWYLLVFYAILRSVPNKLGGIVVMGLVFVALFLLPFINTSPIRSSNFRPIYKKCFWLFVADCFLLA